MIDSPLIPVAATLQAGQSELSKDQVNSDVAQRATLKASEEFEALFIAEMLAPVFEGLETEGMFGGGSGEKIYRSMMVQEYGKAIARAGGVGISDTVQREILRMQETQS